MKTLHSSIVACSLLTAGLLVGKTASSAELCEFVGRCDNGCYTSVAKKTDVMAGSPNTTESCPMAAFATTPNNEYVSFAIPLDVAPGPVAIECENGFCEVWPQGDSITYSWSATGGLVLDAASGTANPIRGFSCTAGAQGTVTIKAFSPAGASSTLTKTITCPTTP